MANITRYWAKKLVDHSLGKASATMPTTVYLAMFANNPGPDGALTGEPSGNNYARVAITSAMQATDLATGVSTNTTVVQFPTASGSWGTSALAYWGILDASTAGNMLFYGALTPAITVGAGDAPPFPEGSLTLGIKIT